MLDDALLLLTALSVLLVAESAIDKKVRMRSILVCRCEALCCITFVLISLAMAV